jgi:hypothetical protein
MREVLTTQECDELVSLWRRRQRLCERDVGSIYRLVETALRGYNPPELQVLGDGREELIAQFIFSKILRLDALVDAGPECTDDGHSAPSSSYALCAYFRRYLIDCMRASSFKRRVSLGDDGMENQADERVDQGDDLNSSLAEHGLSPQKVAVMAKAFIAALPEPEKLLLCESFGREAAGGLSGVASRHAIASYHYRAGRLGLVHKRESLPADYSKTTLGGWIQDCLGIPIDAENMNTILSVFKILGVEASYV